MRSRSHRMTSSDPKDDWVDGSWTVDCACGVNYDDGEEMVDCDECGVWVHTRCSRYMKSEKSFACDKCKIRNSRNDDSEETEVAQLLIEMPTAAMRMESSYNDQRLSSDQPPSRRPFQLWTEKPMEDRVHIQGIPGGDHALFVGKSSVFSPSLWKASSYVPKKFNFQYREFPCWDRNEDASPNVEKEIENPIDKGVNVLFSFSKENASNTSVGMEERGERGNDDREAGSLEGNKYKGGNADSRHSLKSTTKSRRSFAIHSSKKKENIKTSKEHSGKKRPRDHGGTANMKNKVTPTSDAKVFEFRDDKVAKFNKNGSQSILSSNSGHTMLHQTLPLENGLAEIIPENCKNNTIDQSSQAFHCDISRHDCTEGAVQKQQQDGYQIFASAETSFKSNCMAPTVGSSYAGSVLLRGARIDADKLVSNGEHISPSAVLESRKQDSDIALSKLEGSRIVENSNGSILDRAEPPKVKVETDGVYNDSIADIKQSSLLSNETSSCFNHSVQYTRISSNPAEEGFKVGDSTVMILKSSDNKGRDVDGSPEPVGSGCTVNTKESSDDHYQPNQDMKVIDDSNALSKYSLKPKDESSEAEGQLKSVEINPGAYPPVSSQRKIVVCVGKSSSMPSTNLTSISSVCEDARKVNSRTSDPISKQGTGISNGDIIKKDDVASNVANKVNEVSRKYPKDLSKSSVSSTLKKLHSSKSFQSSVSKHIVSKSKEPVVYTSSRASLRLNAAVTDSSGEGVEPSQTHNASFGQNKSTSSGSLQKCDKLVQSSSKVALARAANPPAPTSNPATLSDEELALLLHQELNSSPRVPRVPRVRQVGSLPQLGSPTATSMLKRTSSFGGKDHNSMFRKKVKDVKDGSRGVHERAPSSPSRRSQTSGDVADPSTGKKVAYRSSDAINLAKKNICSTSSETTNSVPSSSDATGQNSSSIHSPSNISDDVTSVGQSSVHRTLPGLINEIMSKGKRMTYEELCNAVLPHWNNLRKHNGERYAYASHFQAVLDCLRNRTEWAQLVDRGPKTNAGRKKRKVDSEQELSFESEDKHGKGRTEKEVESENIELHHEEVPKGKRKARKRRLALQGRGINDVRKKRKVDVSSDEDDDTSQSFKSGEGLFSDDEFQGRETSRAETEDSGSSEET